ncbi:N-acetylglucosamine-specific PTS transporter subunit IIBC [Endozoicomonadaceae bacterium StTr2]
MSILGYLQRLGRALMLPVATLPIAALLLRLGQPDLLDIAFMAKAGGAIFDNLPLLFAMGVATGLSRDNAGAATLAGAIGFFVLDQASQTINPDINMSFFGGIISGVLAGHTYNRFSQVRLPDYLSFFGGSRLVPILTGLFALLLAWVCGYIWPVMQNGIDAFGRSIADSGLLGEFIYGSLNRALIPFGLHHVINSIFWFGLGDFVNAAGDIVNGDLHRFFAGDPEAGKFMAGFYPVMMFGLPAAAFAMYLAAAPDKRKQVGGALFSVALTSFLTGVTEPLEFMFMFQVPVLYFVHAILTGISLMLANQLEALHGFGFSAGLFDFVLNWGLATRPERLVILGVFFGVIYFCVFYFSIRIFHLRGPGWDDGFHPNTVPIKNSSSKQASSESFKAGKDSDTTEKAEKIASALGGIENLTSIDACITRLRLVVKNQALVDETALKVQGAQAVVSLGKGHVQVVLGAEAEPVAEQLKQLL